MSDFNPIGTVAFFRERHRVESATTGRVLRALPTGKLSYQPHVNFSTAGDTAWTIVRCLRLCNELTQTKRAEVVHDAHPVYEELIAAFHDNSSLLSEAVLPMTQATWLEEREVTSNGALILRQSLGQIFWLFLFDAIHHRGQLSIRVTGALIEHLKKQEAAAVLIVSSVLGFTPMAMTAVYSSTKAALHSYAQSLRFKLRQTPARVLEVIPPWIRTELLNSSEEPRAMPLDEFLAETMAALAGDSDEIMVPRAQFLRDQAGPNEAPLVSSFNEQLEAPQP